MILKYAETITSMRLNLYRCRQTKRMRMRGCAKKEKKRVQYKMHKDKWL